MSVSILDGNLAHIGYIADGCGELRPPEEQGCGEDDWVDYAAAELRLDGLLKQLI